ncbi:MAG: UDP-glucose--hexose-1-phosphate uridylyltransferase [Acidobacteriota bacterium]|nr:UDP-glucose--hexose-1-phosphate uridylyltransferase [Acidobacteriota bacterium]
MQATAFASGDVLQALVALVDHACDHGLIGPADRTYAANLLLDALRLEPPASFCAKGRSLPAGEVPQLEGILSALLDDAVARGVIDGGIASRDLLDTRLMGCVTPRPSQVAARFWELHGEDPRRATDYLYRLALDSDYIRSYRIAKDRTWVSRTAYGDLDITINLSKPEKDPKAIAVALGRPQDSYPRCLLCPQNEGYAGRLDHPARQTIRLIPLTLAGEPWYLQYSPYVYYNEHCIVLSEEHRPMRIDRATFVRLLEFVELLPHYTVGSNADLPIVGGSILTHEHYQGGCYEFAMARAGLRRALAFPGFEDVRAGIVEWPLSVIRLDGGDPARLVELADRILSAWRGHSDPGVGVLSETDGTPHNTITPIARRRGGDYELDLVLRNNRTSDEHPLGIFHPHAELHHIKRENIGLIEVMGLAVLPARLLGEMELLKEVILAGGDVSAVPALAGHAAWAADVLARHPQYAPERVAAGEGSGAAALDDIIQNEIGLVFARVLEHCAVFDASQTGQAAFSRFVASVGGRS